jgi:hypothetical protein
MSARQPDLSVVLVTDDYPTISRVIESLEAQTVRDAIEVVIVIPRPAADGIDRERLRCFASSVIVEVDSILPMPPARAAGVRATTAPVIFIGETHSFPDPGFAAALIAAHEGPWDVVVPGLDNANPLFARSWASFLLDYGYWHETLPESAIGGGPTWNASYKRDTLLELGPKLDGALSSGDELPSELKARRRKFYFAPAAKIGHVNLESDGWLDERFLSGLVVGANRAKRWSVPRRLFYAAASPLIPFVLLSRNVAPMRRLYRERRLPGGSAAAIVAGAFVRTFGEVVGYLRGLPPNAETRMERYELKKLDYVKTSLRAAQ